jgi:hypothetical protein
MRLNNIVKRKCEVRGSNLKFQKVIVDRLGLTHKKSLYSLAIAL